MSCLPLPRLVSADDRAGAGGGGGAGRSIHRAQSISHPTYDTHK